MSRPVFLSDTKNLMNMKHRFINEWERPDDVPIPIDSAPGDDLLQGLALWNDLCNYIFF